MDTQTILFIILAAIVSLALVLFQYSYKNKGGGKLIIALAFLRFIAFFGSFLLLINPKFTQNTYSTEKVDLVVLVDNSSSMASSKETVNTILEAIDGNPALAEKFNIEKYRFDSRLGAFDSLGLDGQNTNISGGLKGLQEIYASKKAAVVLLSDGNQTLGQDYGFYGQNSALPVYPVAIGDTTKYEDVALTQVNVNRYAFLKNKYPIEIYVSYFGNSKITVPVTVSEGGKRVFRENVNLSGTKNSAVVKTLLDANSVGVKSLQLSVGSLENERNLANNKRETVVEVIDEKTKVAIVSSLMHPDIGTLKKSIESNGQRNVVIKKPTDAMNSWDDVDLFILYQPNASFKSVFGYTEKKRASRLLVTGPQTDFNFLNRVQKSFTKNSYNQEEEVFAVLNPAFALFGSGDFSLTDFPPLKSSLGDIVLHGKNDVLLTQRIRGIDTNQPLLAFFETEQAQREAVFFGENIWKWRMQAFRNDRNFKNFDDFMGLVIRYLATRKSRERLALIYENVYENANGAKVEATYFDKAFTFDANAQLNLQLKNSDTGKTLSVPMLLKGIYYEADLSNLDAGKYSFTVTVANENISKSGTFTVLDFDVEKQFVATNDEKLARLAKNTGAQLFFPDHIDDLLGQLTTDDRYLPIQKNEQNVVSLVDYEVLLAIIVLALTTEWVIRKYNGLI
ncbi:VWA domain-containing protein [Zobellia galactanivorans]|uniref:VWA domain-containing protein n=1 Tax=Zobellia galactanivorans (strain DSM 12802 / CCUG 47099 / CIP 106680 / NCIMB 13871 / Dsij) TaxID=63186 RepID=UPI0026E42ACC|nr:VWA domain-containing protein [Zobellia galactanivorans]MDO6808996.1 VWA domain-containing protein [Zobellia galactanivorans]